MQNDTTSTINAAYALVSLGLATEIFAGTPLEPGIRQAIDVQARFLVSHLRGADGAFFEGYALGHGPVSTRKTLAAQSAAVRGLYAAYAATGNEDFLQAADAGYDYLVTRFWSEPDQTFRTALGEKEAVYTPKNVAILSGALREARLVGKHEEATRLYVVFWNRVVNRMQLAEGPNTGEVGGDSDGDGIPFIPEQPDHLPPIVAERVTLRLQTQTGVADSRSFSAFPRSTDLAQNYPNPFNPSTVIRFTVTEPGTVVLAVYNTRGQRVALLVNGWLNAGRHAITFRANRLPAGIYFARLTAGEVTRTRKLILLK